MDRTHLLHYTQYLDLHFYYLCKTMYLPKFVLNSNPTESNTCKSVQFFSHITNMCVENCVNNLPGCNLYLSEHPNVVWKNEWSRILACN